MPSYTFTGLTPGRSASVFRQGRGSLRTSVASGVVAADGSVTLTLDVGDYRAEDGRSVAYVAQADDATTDQADAAVFTGPPGTPAPVGSTATAGVSQVAARADHAHTGKKSAAIAAPSGGLTQDAEARAAINSIRAALQAHGLTL